MVERVTQGGVSWVLGVLKVIAVVVVVAAVAEAAAAAVVVMVGVLAFDQCTTAV